MPKKTIGAPSKYAPAYCNELIECLARGHSVTGFAGLIGVGRRTVFDWLERHSEFAEAYEVAKAKAVYFWEERHIEFSRTGEGNAAGIIFGLKNRASDDWSDKVVNEHTGPGGGALEHKVEITFVEAK